MLPKRLKLPLLVFIIELTLNFDQHKVHAHKYCTTSNFHTGICVQMSSCKTKSHLQKTDSAHLSILKSEHVRQLQCGTINNVPYTCCETYNVENEAQFPPEPQTNSISRSGSIIVPSSEVSFAQTQSGLNILRNTKCGDKKYGLIGLVSNGEDAKVSEYPWMALLVYSDGVMEKSLDCAGTLITDRYVLTAAHCIRVANKKLISVRLGEHNTKETIDCVGEGYYKKCAPPLQEIDIEKAIYHKDYYSSNLSNDIGLLRLKSQAIFSSNVQPVCLPTSESSLTANLKEMIISGWGKVENGAQATILQKGIIPLRENDFCSTILNIKLTDNHLCAGGGDQKVDTCLGDSGGPIFCLVLHGVEKHFVQYGVVSVGSFQCGLEYPTIFSRVEKYLPWIAGNLSL